MSNRAMEIREEIVTISEQYDAFLRKFGNVNPEACEVLDSMVDEALELLEEFKLVQPDPDVEHCGSHMENILVELASLILCDQTRVSHNDLRYFIYDGRPI